MFTCVSVSNNDIQSRLRYKEQRDGLDAFLYYDTSEKSQYTGR